jgi:2-isopropylmalate synthase
MTMLLKIYDTTLRDGTQREGISLSVEDKIKITHVLDELGVHYIEGGWPGSNPKDAEFFRRMQSTTLQHAKIAAFGSTRHAKSTCDSDANTQALLAANTPVVTLVGKSSVLHVEHVLETTRDENIRMIADSVAYFVGHGKEVVYDAEHFFDGYLLDADYTLATITAAAQAGATVIVLCDTNGGALPHDVTRIVTRVIAHFAHLQLAVQLGIHTHNDGALAVANALAAIDAGARHVQGTINGIGERCGNMDLIALIANTHIKLGYHGIAPAQIQRLSIVSHMVADICNLNPDHHAPFVGRSAFAHKGGIHAQAVAKFADSYQHIDPNLVGNEMRIVVSELSGRNNIRMRAAHLGLDIDGNERVILQKIKELEQQGLQFEAAEGSFEMLIRRNAPGYVAPFELLDFTVLVDAKNDHDIRSQAMVKLRVKGHDMHTAAEGDGPVNALDQAIRKALAPFYPQLANVALVDYKVRIVDEHLGTAARPRVIIESARGDARWTTVGCSENILAASWQALWDALELPLARYGY